MQSLASVLFVLIQFPCTQFKGSTVPDTEPPFDLYSISCTTDYRTAFVPDKMKTRKVVLC